MLSFKTVLTILLSWLASTMLPTVPFILLMVCLVFADLFTGLKKAEFLNIPRTPGGLRRTVTKISLYFIAILLARLIEVTFSFPDWANIVFVVAALISATEFKSNIRNISIYTQKDYWAKISERLPSIFNWSAPDLFKDNDVADKKIKSDIK